MTARFRSERWRKRLGYLYIGSPLTHVLLFSAVLIVTYVITRVNTPISVRSINIHDDALYMNLGRSLSQGHWLGPFDQLTLMKGPGYPVFLAVASRLGISVSLAHALFHCAAVGFFAAVIYRLTRSLWLSAALFATLLWHPMSITVSLQIVVRDAIYYGQVFIFLGAFAYALLGATTAKERFAYGALSGAFLGWLWLTREEGVWLVPAIALITAVAAVRAYRAAKLAQFATTLAAVAALFAVIQIGFQAANWRVYGKFVGVDIKEANFQRVLSALDGVESGGVRPFVPITRAARDRVYTVSPAFASLRPYFEGAGGKGWMDLSCRIQSVACGDIAAGFFIWSLRDAAAAAGHYRSPRETSDFFGRIADEISRACERGALVCNPPLVAEMPHVTRDQLWQIPRLYLTAFDILLVRNPFPIETEASSGNAPQLEANLQFLNHPLHTPSSGIPRGLGLLGWYYRAGDDWFSARLTRHGETAAVELRRLESPDIARGFHDDNAGTQRFSLQGDCGDACTLELTASDGARTTIESSQLSSGSSVPLGGGTIHFDVAHNEPPPAATPRRVAAIAHFRAAVSGWYSAFLAPILLLGMAAFVATSLRYFRSALSDNCYVVALALWVMVFARVTLLVVISATAFPTLIWLYLTPAFFLSLAAAVVSIAAAIRLAARARFAAPAAGFA
jgi:hypothetical protein